MNLTSKRMLQFIAGCAGVCALTATATTATNFVADSFEATDGSAGLPISSYKRVISGGGNQFTNFAWLAQSGDSSTLIQTNTYTGLTRPMTNEAQNLVLNLSTEGNTLTRNLGVTNDFFAGDPVYVDTLIKFTASEDNPTNMDANVKAAVFVNVSSNLMVYHGVDQQVPASTAVTTVPLDTTQWYRLTILLGKFNSGAVAGFQVFLNDVAITNAAAYNDDLSMNGTWFLNAAAASTTLSAVAFQGTGMVDELVVTSKANGYGTPAVILLTLSFGSDIQSVLTNGAPALTGAIVPSGTAVAINAAPWYHLNPPVPASVSVFNQTSSNDSCKSGTVTSATSEGMSFSASINRVTVSYNPTYLSSAVSDGTVVDATSAFSIAPVNGNQRHVDTITGGTVTGGQIFGANNATVVIGSALNVLTLSYGAELTGTTASGSPINATTSFSIAPVDQYAYHVTSVSGGSISGGTIEGANGATVSISSALNTLTLSKDGGIASTTLSGTPVTTASATSTISVNSKEFNRYAGVTGGTFTGNSGDKIATGTVKGTNGAVIVFSSAAATASDLSALSAYGTKADKIAAWAAANGNKTEADLLANAGTWLNDYLMNSTIGTGAQLSIASITVDPTAATVVVTTDKAVDLSQINGSLISYTADDLTNFGNAATNDLVGATTSQTIVIPVGTGHFIKAEVK